MTWFKPTQGYTADIHLEQIALQSQALENQIQNEYELAQIRWKHAKELLGKSYSKSVVKTGEKISNLDDFLLAWTQRSLKGTWKSKAHQIAQTILQESKKHHFDPIFIMAVIQCESSFNPHALGSIGERGLMQLTPETAFWISKKLQFPWYGVQQLENPFFNIQLGTAYLAYLRDMIGSKNRLYIAAYNMGIGNVQKHISRQVVPKTYIDRVMKHYVHYYSKLKEELKQQPQA